MCAYSVYIRAYILVICNRGEKAFISLYNLAGRRLKFPAFHLSSVIGK